MDEHYKATPRFAQQQTTDQILQERGKEYGPFKSHARITQELHQRAMAHLGKQDSFMNPEHIEALHMIFHKIGRLVNGNPNHRDSWADIAGYAQLVVDIIDGKNT